MLAGADAVRLLRRAEDGAGLRLVRFRRRTDSAGRTDGDTPPLPFAYARLESGQSVIWSSALDVPDTAAADRAALTSMGAGPCWRCR